MVLIMGNKTLKAALCLLIIAMVFAGIGCAGRNDSKNDQGSTATATTAPVPAATDHPAATPTPAPAATTTPAPTVQPGNVGNYTTDLSPDDVSVSDGDQQDEFPEDSLPTPSAE
jgi:type IV secretory pathway VirB10-like protein